MHFVHCRLQLFNTFLAFPVITAQSFRKHECNYNCALALFMQLLKAQETIHNHIIAIYKTSQLAKS